MRHVFEDKLKLFVHFLKVISYIIMNIIYGGIEVGTKKEL